jgi:hypothetical protein
VKIKIRLEGEFIMSLLMDIEYALNAGIHFNVRIDNRHLHLSWN